MKRFLKNSADIIAGGFSSFFNCVGSNLRNFCILIRVCLPYAMWFLGGYGILKRGEFTICWEIFLPLTVSIVTGYLEGYANKIGKGSSVPVPEKRFTEKGEDGEVLIENSRLEELILYMDSLEDYLQRKGYTNKTK